MEVCRELDSLMVAAVVGQLVGVWQDRRWVRGVVEKEDDDGCVWLHGVDHLLHENRSIIQPEAFAIGELGGVCAVQHRQACQEQAGQEHGGQ